MKHLISLSFYEEKYKDKLMAFDLPDEQAEFTGLPVETLQSALQDDNKYPVVIADGDTAVGFFILHTGNGISDFYPDYSEVMLLRAFLIDYPWQGKGIAKTAMSLLPQFMRSNFPLIGEIVLVVNEKNTSAGRLYIRAGFIDHGLRRVGAKGRQRILQYDLTNIPKPNVSISLQQDDILQKELIEILSSSEMLMGLFKAAKSLEPHPYYIGAGCLVQTVWNKLTGRPLDYGIGDIDIIYYQEEDLGYIAEDTMVKKGKDLFAGVPFPVDIKNQARVHLWYPDKFGIELQPYRSLEAAIDTWPTTATCLGVRLNVDDSWHVYAPYGLDDLFRMIVRPNKLLISESIYYNKAHKWEKKWPELKIIPWT